MILKMLIIMYRNNFTSIWQRETYLEETDCFSETIVAIRGRN